MVKLYYYNNSRFWCYDDLIHLRRYMHIMIERELLRNTIIEKQKQSENIYTTIWFKWYCCLDKEAPESVMCEVIKIRLKKDCNEKWERKPAATY